MGEVNLESEDYCVMKVCLAQTKIYFEDKNKNFIKAKKLISEASVKGQDLILFPEMSFTGFSMNTKVIGESDNETLKMMSNLANEYNINIGFGWVKKDDAGYHNQYSIVNRNGEEVADYAKIHPFSYSEEDLYYKAGEELCVFELDNIKMAVFICYDLRFPELFQAVADKVSMVIIPANWPAKRSNHWKTLLTARAIENQVYIVAVNCQGDMNGQYYSGDSCIINPNGDVLNCISDHEGLVECELVDDVAQYREKFPVLKDRRPKLYAELFENIENCSL